MPFTFASAFAGKGPKPKFTDSLLKFGEKQKPRMDASKIWSVMENARIYQNSIHGRKGAKVKNG